LPAEVPEVEIVEDLVEIVHLTFRRRDDLAAVLYPSRVRTLAHHGAVLILVINGIGFRRHSPTKQLSDQYECKGAVDVRRHVAAHVRDPDEDPRISDANGLVQADVRVIGHLDRGNFPCSVHLPERLFVIFPDLFDRRLGKLVNHVVSIIIDSFIVKMVSNYWRRTVSTGLESNLPCKMPLRESNLKVEKSSNFPDTRGQSILTAIINEHFVTGEPVGSKTIAEKFANASGLSPASIRTAMGELEDLGLLEQPHTSAGRVPTNKGYRFYVDNLLGVLSISNDDLYRIGDEFGLNASELVEAPDRLMERTSQLLSALSNNVGIVVSPSLANDRLQHIEFVNLSENRILVVLVSAPNIVHNRIIRLNMTLSKEELERTANYLNAEFAGKSLAEIRAEILRLMHEEKTMFDRLLQTAVILCSQSIEGEENSFGELYIDGASNILTKRDFADLERLRELLTMIGEKSRLLEILNECIARDTDRAGEVQVMIGSENRTPSLQNCTLISAPYRVGGGSAVGTLTVLGPTRIEYARMISIVSYVARVLEKVMSRDIGNN
jgi:heat-inducible transcriptional repressor